jgi:two-component sensor histidine kinase
VRREVRWRFDAVPLVPAEVRRRLGKEFCSWGLEEDDTEAPILVANELVTNAVEHAGTSLELAVRFDGSVIVIAVSDGSPGLPRVRPHDPSASRGRGLQVVVALARRWGCTSQDPGKTVWAEIDPLDARRAWEGDSSD